MTRRLALAAAALVLLAGCAGYEYVDDPRYGHVEVDDYTVKFCDGTTLIYDGYKSMAAVADSPECQR